MDETLRQLQSALGDRYTFDRVIGRGGMATVYLAEELHPHRKVAVKVLTSEFSSQLMRTRFLREVNLASNLIHPHIVPVFAAGEAGDLLYYVMPYIDGESLRQRLKRTRVLPAELSVEIARDVAGALHYAHEIGVIHRDIKPENILLTDDHALVTDFGIARAIGAAGAAAHLTQTGLPLGTPAYMSPEQWSASGDVDRRTDIYSLGCVLFECLGGNIRNTNPVNRVETVRHVLASAPQAESTTGGLVTALERALAPSPNERFDTAADFAKALGQTTEPVAAVTQWGRKSRLLGIGIITAVAVAIALASGMFLTTRGTDRVPGRVAVALFENQTGDPSMTTLGPMAADWITQGLAQTGLVEVVGTRSALSALGSESGEADPIQLLANETGAGIVVSGAYYLQGPTVQFQARITDTDQMRVLRALPPVSGPVDSALAVVESLRQRVMGALATLFDDRLSSWAQVTTQPPSFEAYEEYMEGLTLFMRLRTDEGIAHLYQAWALDTTFATPLVFAAFAHSTKGEWAKADSLGRIVSRLRDRLAPMERHMVDWVLANTRGDQAGAMTAVRKAAETAPGSEALSLVALSAINANHPREALDALAQLDPTRGLMRGFFLYWSYTTNALHMLGEHRRELEAARRGLQQYPNNPFLLGDEVLALVAVGRIDEASRKLRARAEFPARPWMTVGDEFRITALELAYHGHDSAGAEVLSRSLDWYRSLPADQAATEQVRYGLARTLYVAGELDEAESMFRPLAEEVPDSIGYHGYLGAIAARRGDREQALAISQSLTGLRRDFLFGDIPFWQARIAAVLGERDRAVALLDQAFRQGRPFSESLHFTVDFLPLRDYAPFVELLRPKG